MKRKLVIPDVVKVGIREIDEQHQEIADQIAGLQEFVGVPVTKRTVVLVTKISDSVFNHFRDEENIMKEKKFYGVRLHAQNHKKYFESLTKICKKVFENGCIQEAEINKMNNLLLRDVFDDDLLFQEFLATEK